MRNNLTISYTIMLHAAATVISILEWLFVGAQYGKHHNVTTNSILRDFMYPNQCSLDDHYRRLWRKHNISFGGFHQKYSIVKLLGSGASGQVYKVRHKENGIIYAAKVVRTVDEDFWDKKRTFMEVAIMQSHRNPALLKLIEGFRQNSTTFIAVFPFLSGGDLQDIYRDESGVAETSVKEFMRQSLWALKSFHDRGMIHGDFKPENIMRVSNDSNHVVVLDYSSADTVVNVNIIGRVFAFTACYSAPEVTERRRVNTGADMWAVGATTYFMFSGAPPFGTTDTEGSSDALRSAIIEADLEFSPKFTNVSMEAIDFMVHLIRRLPRKRMDVNEALGHPWIGEKQFELHYERYRRGQYYRADFIDYHEKRLTMWRMLTMQIDHGCENLCKQIGYTSFFITPLDSVCNVYIM